MSAKTKRCAGVRISGYWKGWPCGAVTTATFKGKAYCAAHHSVAQVAPEKFTKARASFERVERKRRATIREEYG